MTDLVAMGDQAAEEMKPMARALASFYLELIKSGVPPEHAVMVAQTWIASVIAKTGESDGDASD